MAAGNPRKLHARFGGMGAWGIAELEAHAKGRDLQAFRFEWLQEFEHAVPLDEVKEIHASFNPISVVRLPSGEGTKLLERGRPL